MEDAKHSVLIIDDQRINITELSKALRPDFRIFAAGNGPDALIAAEENLPDVILLDIQMAGMDGYEVITELKKSEKTKNIPVIFITGRGDAESEERGLALGAVDYIRKPFSSSIVKLRVCNQIELLEMTEKLEAALKEAQAANEAKSIFLSNMSHEIRTPMNAIIGMGELLLHENLNERQKAYVDDIATSSKALLEIINDILDFSKIESGKLELNPVDYDLFALLSHIESMFAYITNKKGLQFILEPVGDLPEILFGDDLRIRQILTNILGNAVKFTEKGYVRLRVTASESMLIFEITDTGIGIRKEDQPKLFKAFEQMDKTINRNIVGTGLGLVISRSFVEMMGGEITLESEYGQGTVFTIAIPVVAGNRELVIRDTDEEQWHAIYAPEANVLVVDDNEFNRKVASGLLSLMDIEAEETDSGIRAIDLVREKDYDIVLMDHMMPGMDGVEATLEIRRMGGKYELLPIVALTANAVSGAKEMFLKNKFNGFISKPIDSHELSKVLEIWLPPEKVQIRTEPDDKSSRANKEDKIRKKTMVTFVKENNDTYEHITDSLSKGDIRTAHRIAHTLKSCAGYLGKHELSDAALSLEVSLNSATPAYLPEQLEAIKKGLEEALREFEPMLKEAESNSPDAVQIDAKAMTTLLLEIKPLLEKGDFGASEYVEKLQGIVGMKELAERIEDYDFEGALQIFNSLSETQ